MTEIPLYAGLRLLILWMLLGGTALAQDAQRVCATCIGTTIGTGQALLLPEKLHGLTILVRDRGEPLAVLAGAVADIAGRGGRPAVLVTAESSGAGPEQALLLKRRLTELRGSLGADLPIALRAPVDADLAPYVEAVVGGRREEVPAGVRFWPTLPYTDAPSALAATVTGDTTGKPGLRDVVDLWVIDAPGDVILARSLVEALAGAAAPPPDALVEAVEVSGRRRLTADEIVARHQAVADRQSRLVTRTISAGVLTLTFEAPGFPAPITITSDTVIFSAPGRTELEQRAIRVNGIEFKGGGVPRLPLLEPERVASPPLTITLTRFYRYRLAGEESVNGIRCYVVAFEPVDQEASLFRGRAYIAIDSFAMVRVAGTQTRLRGAIVSSEQVDDFREVRSGVWLLAQSDVRQIYEGAAHRTPIHRLLTISTHEVNPPDFESRLNAAYNSPSVMLRDTPEGYRYLTRTKAADVPGGKSQDRPVVHVASASRRVRALTAGVIIDPNISVPLPFAGLSYIDFDLFGTGAQLNAFFGGSYGQLAFSMPSIAATRWQIAGRAFGIAGSYNDRSFRDGREVYEENLSQRPAHASIWLLRPISPRLTIRAGYEFDYTHLRSAAETGAAFLVPADQIVHGARVAIEGQRSGWAGSIWWNPARRAGWRTWGRTAQDYSPSHAAFQRFGATIARSFAVNPGVVARVEGAAMSGDDLDRFSRFSFGTFENRLRGYPAALVRYDRGAIIRGAVASSIGRVARLDLFLDSAVVRDRGYGRAFRNYTGVGTALEAPAPFGLLTAVEWGYGFRGLNADGTRGTHVIRVSAYKMF